MISFISKIIVLICLLSSTVIGEEKETLVNGQCTRIGNKLGSVSIKDCLDIGLIATDGESVKGAAILIKEYPPLEKKEPLGKVLLIGGIHGDEYSSVSIIFKWLATLNKHHSGLFHWHVIPLLNPDGLLRKKSQRINENNVDLLSLHARTVLGGYRSKPSYSHVEKAVRNLKCPVMLNGNVSSASSALQLRGSTGAYGVMIGRSAIRNPWIFRQIRESQSGKSIFLPKLGDVYEYVDDLYLSLAKPGVEERKSVARMKKFLNFVGLSVDPEGKFLHKMRRALTKRDLFSVCSSYLLDNGREGHLFNIKPFDGLVARPSSESVDSGCQV